MAGVRRLPSALAACGEITGRLSLDGGPAFFLDFDGTLSPIVPDPADAVLLPGMREVLERLARRWPVAVVSGRGLADVRSRVLLPQCSYVGSHGFEIEGPEGSGVRFEQGAEFLGPLRRAEAVLRAEVGAARGAIVERKPYALSVHVRRVADDLVPSIAAAVERVTAMEPALRQAVGRKVFELRPDLDWNKGSAVEWLLRWPSPETPLPVPLYVGDDITDEDGFRAVRPIGVGVLVTDPRVSDRPAESTEASYGLLDPNEVRSFLGELAEQLERL